MSSRTWTYAKYAALPNDGRRFEVIEGSLVEMPAPTRIHQRIIGELFAQLRLALLRTEWECLFAPVDVKLSGHGVSGQLETVVQPDLIVVSKSGRPEYIEGAPVFVLEVVSQSSVKHDFETKRRLYEIHGVSEYWIVDPVLRQCTVWRRAGAVFHEATVYDFSTTVAVRIFPGVALELSSLIALGVSQLGEGGSNV